MTDQPEKPSAASKPPAGQQPPAEVPADEQSALETSAAEDAVVEVTAGTETPVAADPTDTRSSAEKPAGDSEEPAGGSPAAPSSARDRPDPEGGWPGLRERLRPGPLTPTRAITALLLALLGFTFTVQVRSVADDPSVAALGQEDLVRILANLDSHEERLRQDIAELQETHRRLTTAGESQQEALAEASRRADELGILAGTLPVTGPGLVVKLHGDAEMVDAARLLDAVQELRSAGAEAMQLQGTTGPPVRVVAATYFIDSADGIVVDGEALSGPYTLTAIGEPQTLAPALQIPGGVVESVQRDGGTVTLHEEPDGVEVTAVREPAALEHARPGS